MMWIVDCSVIECGTRYYEAPTKDEARTLAAQMFVHAPIPHSNTWYFSIVPCLDAKRC
jgi:hypothetical protein